MHCISKRDCCLSIPDFCPPPAQDFCLCCPLTVAMSSIFHLEHLFLTFQSPLFFASSLAAFILLAILYAAHSNAPSSIPLYVPETSAAGNQKKRWMFDSVNLLQEAYKKVRKNDSVFLLIYRWPLHSSTASPSEFGRPRGIKLSFLQIMWMNWRCYQTTHFRRHFETYEKHKSRIPLSSEAMTDPRVVVLST